MERYLIKDKKILETYSYLAEIEACHLYEIVTGIFPVEASGLEYNNEILKFIEDNSKKFGFKLISFYSWHTGLSEIFDCEDFSSGHEKRNFWFYSEKLDLIIKLGISESAFLSLASKAVGAIDNFVKQLEKYKKVRTTNEIGIIYSVHNGLDIKKIPIDPMNINIELNYGQDFVGVHNKILSKLKTKTVGGYIFRGKMGTGKSTYIKYLAQTLTDRLFIFIPTGNIDSLASPNLVSLLLKYPNSVLIIEDAEQAVMSREDNPQNASLVSTILNLTDGILGALLNVSIILTFNTERSNVDSSILRKGRLQIEWEFKHLSIENGRGLAKSLGKDENLINEEMSLADIYNIEEETFHKETVKSRVGFVV